MNAKSYLLTFTPFGRYYFGTSRSFAESFFAVSQKFPGQTTILGCLRYILLIQNGFGLTKNPKKENLSSYYSLTGKSVMNSLDEVDPDLGIIKKISPVFIVKNDLSGSQTDYLFELPCDVVRTKSGVRIKDYNQKPGTKNNSNRISEDTAYSKSFEEKDFVCDDKLGGREFWLNYLKGLINGLSDKDEVFISDKQPGLGRDPNKRTANEKEFYVKKDYRLKKNYSFGVIVHLDDSNLNINNNSNTKKWKLENDDVRLGGENSWFRMKILPFTDNTSHLLIDRFINLSDYGDFEDSKYISEKRKLIFLSHLIGAGELKYPHAIIPDVAALRMWESGSKKTDSFMSVPQNSVIYNDPQFEIDKSRFKSFDKKIGFNWAIKV